MFGICTPGALDEPQLDPVAAQIIVERLEQGERARRKLAAIMTAIEEHD